MSEEHKTKHHPNVALELLKDGASFVLHPELRFPRSRKHVLRMRMRLADGTLLPSIWNYPKVRLDRMGKLKEGKSKEGWKTWTLR